MSLSTSRCLKSKSIRPICLSNQVQFVLPSDQIARLQQRVRMSDVDLRRLGNIADIVKLSFFAFAMNRQAADNVSAQVGWRPKEGDNLFLADTLLEVLANTPT